MFKYKFLTASVLAVALFMCYSCEDTDSYAPASSEPTLAQLLRQDADLEQFVEIVDLCGEGRLDSLFAGRVRTVWAPVDDSFDADEYKRRINEDKDCDNVFNELVTFHVANNLHAADDEIPAKNKVVVLNGKIVSFFGNLTDRYTFDGKEILESVRAKNGIIHKIAASGTYYHSIWETLKRIPAIESFWNFCNRYTVREIDHAESMNTGQYYYNQQIFYKDTIYKTSFTMLNNGKLGKLNNEDSSFVFFAPSSVEWERIVEESKSYFKYDYAYLRPTAEQKEEFDSITTFRGANEYLRYLTFSMSQQQFDGAPSFDNLPDSLLPMRHDKEARVATAKYITGQEPVLASNGRVYVLDAMPYGPTDLWHDTIVVETENFANIRVKQKDDKGNSIYDVDGEPVYVPVGCSKSEQNPEVSGKLSGNSYLKFAQNTASAASIRFFIRNVLSAKYKLAFILVPEHFRTDDSITSIKGNAKNNYLYKLEVSHKGQPLYADEKNVNLAYNPAGLDTIFVKDSKGDEVVFDLESCEDYSGVVNKNIEDKDYTFEVNVNATFETVQGLRKTYYIPFFNIDALLLIPVEDDDETVSQ